MRDRLRLGIAVLLVACGTATPESIADWTCDKVLYEGQDPDEAIDAMVAEQRESGVSDEAMVKALWAECGVELGIPPPP